MSLYMTIIPMCDHGLVDPRPSHASSLAFLLSQIGARSARLFAADLAAVGVTPRAYGVLSNLALTDGQTQQQLADALGIHRNNMVSLIDDLEQEGWVRRHRNSQDRRAFNIRITEEGAGIVQRVEDLLPGLDDRVGHGLEPDRRRILLELLEHVARALDLRPGVHPQLSARG
jgi:DNA-binding MarR family transcriptional regulator